MSPDQQLLQDAHDAALNVVAILERPGTPDRVTIESADRWARLACCKLLTYRIQQRDDTKNTLAA